MGELRNWTSVTYDSLLALWAGVLGFIPLLLGALIVLIVGLVVASVLKLAVERLVATIRLDSFLRRLGVDVYFERAGLHLNSARFFGLMVYWFVVIVLVQAIADVFDLGGLSLFLNNIVLYIPNIIAAVLIMLAAVILANFLRGIVRASILSARLHASKFLGTLTWWTVVIFGLLAALLQLGIAVTLINTVVTGLIAMIALAGGIASGLGGKDYASHLLEKLREETEGR